MLTKKQLLQKKEWVLKLLQQEMQKRKLLFYNTGKKVHAKQLEFHKSLKRNRWAFGGNRSGKTECGAVETVWLARGIHPYRPNKPNVRGWVVSLSTRVQKDVAQQKVLSYLQKDWIEDIVMVSGKKSNAESGVIESILVRNVFGGISVIGFKSCEEGREKFQGASLDFVWFDEEPPQDVYQECKMRVLDTEGDIFGTMTPLKGMTFIYDEIYVNASADPEVFCIFMEWADNPFLSQSEIKRLSSTMSAEELEARRYGKFVDKDYGLVYPEFDVQVHVVSPFEVPQSWYDKFAIDPGLHNPLSCHFYAVSPEGVVYCIREHYAPNTNIDAHIQSIKKIMAELNWNASAHGGLIDSASCQHTLASSKSVLELFQEAGIYASPKVNKDILAGIARVKSYLKNANGEIKLYIFSCCTNLIRELKTYKWAGGDRPVKADDHALDELRYYIMSKPQPATIAPAPKPDVLKEKERLIRKLKSSHRG